MSSKHLGRSTAVSDRISYASDFICRIVRPYEVVFYLFYLAVHDAHLHAADVFVVKAEFFSECKHNLLIGLTLVKRIYYLSSPLAGAIRRA